MMPRTVHAAPMMVAAAASALGGGDHDHHVGVLEFGEQTRHRAVGVAQRHRFRPAVADIADGLGEREEPRWPQGWRDIRSTIASAPVSSAMMRAPVRPRIGRSMR